MESYTLPIGIEFVSLSYLNDNICITITNEYENKVYILSELLPSINSKEISKPSIYSLSSNKYLITASYNDSALYLLLDLTKSTPILKQLTIPKFMYTTPIQTNNTFIIVNGIFTINDDIIKIHHIKTLKIDIRNDNLLYNIDSLYPLPGIKVIITDKVSRNVKSYEINDINDLNCCFMYPYIIYINKNILTFYDIEIKESINIDLLPYNKRSETTKHKILSSYKTNDNIYILCKTNDNALFIVINDSITIINNIKFEKLWNVDDYGFLYNINDNTYYSDYYGNTTKLDNSISITMNVEKHIIYLNNVKSFIKTTLLKDLTNIIMSYVDTKI